MTLLAVDLALGWVVAIGLVVCLCRAAAQAPVVVSTVDAAELADHPPVQSTREEAVLREETVSSWLPDLGGPVLARALRD